MLLNSLHLKNIPEQDVMSGVENAARQSRKGKYREGSHDGNLLGRIDTSAVYGSGPNFARLIDRLR